jgi:hypothetical protein
MRIYIAGIFPYLVFFSRILAIVISVLSSSSLAQARFTYAEVVGTTPYYYSVETPTEKLYRFTGVGQRSAQSDMSLYLASDDSFKRVANVELKSGNPPEKHIKKDIEKLICKGCFNKQVDSHLHGNWFHLLENTDSGTLPVLFTKMKNSFLPYSLCAGRVSIVLCFCVLGINPRSGWACLGHFDYCVNHHCYTTYLEKFFSCIDGQLSPDWTVIKIN